MPEYEDRITHNKEERNLEFKQSMDWNQPETKGKITKGILAMSNIRNGGLIVIGVEQQGEEFVLVGMETIHIESFTQDGVASYVANFASPYVEFSLTRHAVSINRFIVIDVKEFSEIPVVCRQDGPEGLRRGAIYTRTRRMNESAQVSSEAEMREILDMAIEKRIRAYFATTQRAGLISVPSETAERILRQQAEEDQRRFQEELPPEL